MDIEGDSKQYRMVSIILEVEWISGSDGNLESEQPESSDYPSANYVSITSPSSTGAARARHILACPYSYCHVACMLLCSI